MTVVTLDRAYRTRLRQLRDAIARQVEEEFASVDSANIVESMASFAERAAPAIIDGQGIAENLATSYVNSVIESATSRAFEPLPPDPSIVGTTAKGAEFEEAMAAIGPSVLGRIGDGASVEDALGTGLFMATSLADNEVTAAADQEADRQAQAADQIIGWEGIVQPGSCDGCLENEGFHELDEEMYRHPSCDCEKALVARGADEEVPEAQLALDLPLSEEERETVVTYEGIPELNIPPDPDYVGEGFGLKVGAEERLEQMKEMEKAGAWATDDQKPWELHALNGDIDKAAEKMQFAWLDSASSPESALMQSALQESDGAVWTRGYAAFEPSVIARDATQEVYERTQATLAGGPETFTVYRGIKSDVTTRNVLESWSTEKEFATRFDGYAVLEAEVPREAVFMDLRTATQFESELVIRGELVSNGSINVLPGTGEEKLLVGGKPL